MVITDYIYVITQENWDSISWHGTASSIRLHICAVTYMTEISLHVT